MSRWIFRRGHCQAVHHTSYVAATGKDLLPKVIRSLKDWTASWLVAGDRSVRLNHEQDGWPRACSTMEYLVRDCHLVGRPAVFVLGPATNADWWQQTLMWSAVYLLLSVETDAIIWDWCTHWQKVVWQATTWVASVLPDSEEDWEATFSGLWSHSYRRLKGHYRDHCQATLKKTIWPL